MLGAIAKRVFGTANERYLRGLERKICLGQGYRGIRTDGLGVGSCTRGFSTCLEGCPPTGREIFEFLTAVMKDNTGA